MAIPRVSILVLNYNGQAHLGPCFTALRAVDYPRDSVELVLLDNASADDSVATVRRTFPEVRCIQFERNLGFSGAYNRGVEQVESPLVLLLNNDTRIQPACVQRLVDCWTRHQPACAAVGAGMLNWAGDAVDFGGATLNFHGFGFAEGLGQAYRPGVLGLERCIPFACGGAALFERARYLAVGGLDEDYFSYFEDVDIGWRLWVLGHEVWFAPDALVLHRGHGSWGKRATLERVQLMELNALRTMIKNLEQGTLDHALPAAMQLAVRRALLDGAGAAAALRPVLTPPQRLSDTALAPLFALDQLAAVWPDVQAKRAQVQAARRVSDAALATRLPNAWLRPARAVPAYTTLHAEVVAAHDLAARPLFAQSTAGAALGRKPRILMICHDTIGPKMAGPAFRQWELARVLGRYCEVTLAAPGTPAREPDGFRLVGYRRADIASLAPYIAEADGLFTLAYILRELPALATMGKPLALDLYIPYMFESLELWSGRPSADQQTDMNDLIRALDTQLRVGDFFVCTSERQRRLWLGTLSAAGRINPATYDADPTLRALVDVVPFVLSDRVPEHSKRVLKGVWPGIGPDDRVILWGSGIWNWFDPLTLVRAIARIVTTRPEVKLFFVARGHFDQTVVPEQAMARETVALARELGLLERHIFFGDWIPYDERENYLLEADIGTSFHFMHIETHFCVRTRLFDYIWTGLPMIVSRGDVLSELVEREGLGRAVDPEDVDGLVAALLDLLDTPDLKAQLAPRFAEVRARFTGERAAQPLLDFFGTPRRAADVAYRADEPLSVYVPEPPPWWRLPVRAYEYLRAGGVRYAWQGFLLYLRWMRDKLRRGAGGGQA